MLTKAYVLKRMNELMESIEICQKMAKVEKHSEREMKRARECASEIGRLADEYIAQRRRLENEEG